MREINALDRRRSAVAGTLGPHRRRCWNPATGEQQAEVDLATRRRRSTPPVAAAKAAFPAWRATSLSRRGRGDVPLPRAGRRQPQGDRLAAHAEHGKVLADAAARWPAGWRTSSSPAAIPHLLKGGYSEQASTGVDVYSIRQPLGVVAGITPFNFPAMVPMWMFANALACGNTFVLKPSEKDPSASLFLAELLQPGRAARRRASTSCRATRRRSTACSSTPTSRRSASSARRRSPGTSTRPAPRTASGCRRSAGPRTTWSCCPTPTSTWPPTPPCRAGYGSAGERCMAISVVVAVGAVADPLVDAIKERHRRRSRSGPASEPDSRDGPADHPRAPRQGRRLRRPAPADGATSWSTAATPALRRRRLLPRRRRWSTTSSRACRSTTTRSSARCCRSCASTRYDEALQLVNDNPYGNGTAIFTRDGGAARQFQFDVQVRHGRRQRADPGAGRATTASAAGRPRCSATRTCTAPRASSSTPAARSSPPAGPTRPPRGRPRLPAEPLDEADRDGLRGRAADQPARAGASSSWPSRPSCSASATCGRSTRTCCGRSRSSSTARSWPTTAGSIVGPMVTNPATRDWTVTASLFATLNEMYGNRTICGIGRGDSAVRVTNGKPTTLATLRECDQRDPRARQRPGRSTTTGRELRFPWAPDSRLEVWVAAYGPKALALTGEVGDGFILQLADPDIAAWTIKAVRDARPSAPGRDPAAIKICVAAPAYVGDDLGRTSATSAAGSAAWSATTSPTSSPATATRRRAVPAGAHRLHQGPPGLRLQRARPGRQHAHRRSCPTRSSTGSASSARSRTHIERLRGAARRSASTSSPSTCSTTTRSHTLAGVRRARSSRPCVQPGEDESLRSPLAAVLASSPSSCLWEGYKAVGGRRRHRVFGVRILPRADDLSMPHVLGDRGPRLRPAGDRRRAARSGGRRSRPAWFTLGVTAVGFVARHARRPRPRRADAAVPGRRAGAAALRGAVARPCRWSPSPRWSPGGAARCRSGRTRGRTG